jgi:sugar phosphate isomerase/epimerase
MVQLGVSSMFFHEYPVDLIFDYVEEAGLSGIEFWVETPHFWVRGMPVEEVRECIDRHPALSPVTLHGPVLDLNPCSINPKIAAVSVQFALQSIEIAESLGASVVTLHPGRRTAKRLPSEADYGRFDYLLRAIRDAGENRHVQVAIENMERKVNSLLCTPEDVLEVLEREPWLSFTLDISHAIARSVGEACRYIEWCHDRIANVHVSSVRGGTLHHPVFGSEDVVVVLRALRDAGYDGPLTLEIEDQNFDHTLCSEEKVAVLIREVEYLHGIFS